MAGVFCLARFMRDSNAVFAAAVWEREITFSYKALLWNAVFANFSCILFDV